MRTNKTNKTSVFNKLSRVCYASLKDCDIEVIIYKGVTGEYRVTTFYKPDGQGQSWAVFKGNKAQALAHASRVFFTEWETGQTETKRARREMLEKLIARGTVSVEYRTRAQRRKHCRHFVATKPL